MLIPEKLIKMDILLYGVVEVSSIVNQVSFYELLCKE